MVKSHLPVWMRYSFSIPKILLPVRLTALTFLVGCSHPGFRHPVPPKTSSVYKVVAVGAVGKRYVDETYTMAFEKSGPSEWTIRTLESSGTIEAAGLASTYDSKAPKSTDPWPATIQFALSSAPARIRFNETFRPEQMVSVKEWKVAAWNNIRQVGLPDSAQKSVEAMLAPEDFVQNLLRDFPGIPHRSGTWDHEVTIAGLTIPTQPTCTRTRGKGVTKWTCQSNIPKAGNDRGKLFDITATTELEVDNKGLLSHTFTYDAVLVRGSSAGQVSHHPAAGKRRVQRLP